MAGGKADLTQVRAHVSTRLAERRAEIEAAVQSRIYAVSNPAEIGDPIYVEGLRAALSAAFDYAIGGLAGGDDGNTPVPAPLLVQARLAARSGVSLDTVLRRYFAGYTLLGDFLMQEAQDGPFAGAALQRIVRTQAILFDRLVAAITEEHSREWKRQPGSAEERRVERVEALLGGEHVGEGEFEYDFDVIHLGVIATGEGGAEAVRGLALELDCRSLLVSRDERTVWAWLGARREMNFARLDDVVAERWPSGLLLALGEPVGGVSGWRLTHRQAKASQAIAMRGRHSVVRYTDIALLASIRGDEVLSESLRELFLAPLARGRDGGAALRETIRAYFAAERNVSSAAAALGVSRQTVINRLHTVEERLSCPLGSCAIELEAALRLEEFDQMERLAGQAPASPVPLQPVKPAPAPLDTLPSRVITQV